MLTPEQFEKVTEILRQLGSTMYSLGEKGMEMTIKTLFYRSLVEVVWDIAFILIMSVICWIIYKKIDIPKEVVDSYDRVKNSDDIHCAIMWKYIVPTCLFGASLIPFLSWITKDLFGLLYPEGMLVLQILKKIGLSF